MRFGGSDTTPADSIAELGNKCNSGEPIVKKILNNSSNLRVFLTKTPDNFKFYQAMRSAITADR
jgi:hypothetical protein